MFKRWTLAEMSVNVEEEYILTSIGMYENEEEDMSTGLLVVEKHGGNWWICIGYFLNFVYIEDDGSAA